MDKKVKRLRRARKTRAHIRELGGHRLTVHRTPRHIYAQVVTADGARTVVAASSLEKAIRSQLQSTGNVEAAKLVGKAVAAKAREAGLKTVAFDRSGFRFHGRVKALAEAARESGLQF